ncbi:MAG: GNAT family N-acetyltransferase, partial [Chloroflexi bacterium]|nr:GNAT family N-acetyltransferase [Chloroflexota bacterium]
MHIIRELNEADWDDFVVISANAYPGIKVVTAADRERFRRRNVAMAADPSTQFYGLLENGRLLGAMRFFDFTMTLHETPALVGGVGGVAVDLAYKKQKAARDMIQFFLR